MWKRNRFLNESMQKQRMLKVQLKMSLVVMVKMVRMMLKPWDLSDYSDDDASNYASVEELIWSYIINLIGNEASKHDDTDNEWVNELLNHADDVRQYAARITVSPTKHASKQLHTKLGTISQGNIKQAEKWLREATGKQVNSIKDSQHFKQIVENQLTETDNYLNLARRNMSTNAYRTFKGIVGDARQSINNGTVPSKAISKASEQWAEQGVPALVDKAGRKWSPDVYVRTVVNSSINSATNDTELLRYRQYGSLVKVSSHIGCRPSHLQYQDHVYSLNGNTDKYPDFESTTGYGTITGIGGINCRHYTIPYIEGYGSMPVPQQSDDDNAARYQLEQTQRRLEREVRKAKRKLIAAKKLGDQSDITAAQELVSRRQSVTRQFVNKHGLVRQYNREKQ
nr:MAG TPA: minor capsid protein [Caudoviricetes sp.]